MIRTKSCIHCKDSTHTSLRRHDSFSQPRLLAGIQRAPRVSTPPTNVLAMLLVGMGDVHIRTLSIALSVARPVKILFVVVDALANSGRALLLHVMLKKPLVEHSHTQTQHAHTYTCTPSFTKAS